MVQQSIFTGLALASALLSNATFAAQAETTLTGCAAKHQAINVQLEEARQHGNSRQQAGLEKALSEVVANCSDESLRQERQEQVRGAAQEVSEREVDLREAMAKGDAEKIATRQAKLAEAREELKQAEDQLNR